MTVVVIPDQEAETYIAMKSTCLSIGIPCQVRIFLFFYLRRTSPHIFLFQVIAGKSLEATPRDDEDDEENCYPYDERYSFGTSTNYDYL